jgi:choline-sulfatase
VSTPSHASPTSAALAVAAALLGAACRPSAEVARPPDLLLIVVDTLRADRLGCYGWSEPTSPHVDALAREGVLFEGLHCQVPQTLPSFCTILTGTYPVTHGVRTNGVFALPERARTLAETLGAAGYRTGAFVAGFPLDRRFGLAQGFETYGDTMRSPRAMVGLRDNATDPATWNGFVIDDAFETSADLITDDAIAWLDARDDRPFFLMVHYFDPHHDYTPPERFAHFSHPYQGEVAFVDSELGRLLEHVDALGLREHTLVAFTADHGECLGEHGRYYHQAMLYEAALHVPLVLRLPGRLPAGKRIPGLCRSVDLMPTLLELLGVPAPNTLEGASLVPAVAAGRTEADVPFESLYGKLELDREVVRTGIVRGRWKLIRDLAPDRRTGAPLQAFELYDLEQDPEELRNLATRREGVVQRLGEALHEFDLAHPAGRADVITPSPAVLAKLKALGYF